MPPFCHLVRFQNRRIVGMLSPAGRLTTFQIGLNTVWQLLQVPCSLLEADLTSLGLLDLMAWVNWGMAPIISLEYVFQAFLVFLPWSRSGGLAMATSPMAAVM